LSNQLEQQEAAMAAFLDHFNQVPGHVDQVSGGESRTDVFLAHDIPGRLRFVAPALKGDDRRAAALCVHLRRLPAVQALQFNVLTGSVLVAYDGLAQGREAILRALDCAGYVLMRQFSKLPIAPEAPRPGNLRRATGVAIRAAIHCMLDLALESAIIAIV
jgi:hypothetical protein